MKSDSYLSVEVWMMGGLSILACVLTWAFVDRNAPLLGASQLAFSLAFIANHPHFLSSYVLLYGDFRKNILRHPRYLWGGIVAPAFLGGAIITGLVTEDRRLMAHIITAMFFLVGWHYVKQVFGCVIVTSAQRKQYYSLFERRVLLLNLFAAWFMSWLTNQVEYPDPARNTNFSFYGIDHYRLNLPYWSLQLTFVITGITLAALIAIHVNRYIKTGAKPSAPGVAAFVALYAWYLPALTHPTFGYFIPFFHSIQYMAFVWVLKRNQVADQIKNLSGEAWRREWINRLGGFFLLAFVLGALTFEIIPKGLDSQGWVAGLGSSPFTAAFLLFINIHHYFIDNVIWRSDNPVVKQYLFAPSSSQTHPNQSPSAA